MTSGMFDDDAIKSLYDKTATIPLFWEIDASLFKATENSIYRKKAIASLDLADDSTVLDAACGTGLNFKIIESYLGDNGRLVGVDISSGVLGVATRRIVKNKWMNVELVNMSIVDYEPEFRFDAALCTFAMTIIPEHEAAVSKIFDLLKPQGKFAMVGMKLPSRMPYRLLSPFWKWFGRYAGVDTHRDVAAYIRSKCARVNYEECFGGLYYILSTSKSHLVR